MSTRKELVTDVVTHTKEQREQLEKSLRDLESITHEDDGDSLSRNERGAQEADPEDIELFTGIIADLDAAVVAVVDATKRLDRNFWQISF